MASSTLVLFGFWLGSNSHRSGPGGSTLWVAGARRLLRCLGPAVSWLRRRSSSVALVERLGFLMWQLGWLALWGRRDDWQVPPLVSWFSAAAWLAQFGDEVAGSAHVLVTLVKFARLLVWTWVWFSGLEWFVS